MLSRRTFDTFNNAMNIVIGKIIGNIVFFSRTSFLKNPKASASA